MKERIVALMVKPGEYPCVTLLYDDRDYLDCMVSMGTDFVCTATALEITKGVVAIHAWEGVMYGLKGNRKVGKRIIAGTFYVVGVENEKLRSLNDDEILKYIHKFGKPRFYTDDEVIDAWFDGLFCAL